MPPTGVAERGGGILERGAGVLDRACAVPTAGVTERGGTLLGREGTSLEPSGLAEPRIRVDVGGGADAFVGLSTGEPTLVREEGGGAL